MLVIVATGRLGSKTSNRTIASYPYTNLNGVFPVNVLHVVLYAHSIVGIFKSQSSLLTLHIFVNAFSMILLNASTVPFARG
jgi:hypothetical protein